MKTKNELVPQLDGTLAVKRNGAVLYCPFVPPIVTAGNVRNLSGQPELTIQRLPCSTGCPFASVDKSDTNYIYYVGCCSELLDLKCDIIQGSPGQYDELI